MIGINYPWTVVDGKPNYGCDFGANVWRAHTGVTTHIAQVRRDLQTMAAIGVEVVRWFVFADGRGGVRWGDAGRMTGLAEAFFDDMDAALEIARDTGVRLCLVLFDYSWMMHRVEVDEAGRKLFTTQPDLLATPAGLAAVLAALVDPVLERYGAGGAREELASSIHSIDVINEPDWVTRGLALASRLTARGAPKLPRPFSLPELRALVRAVADRVHKQTQALVTVGGGLVRFASEWDDAAYNLDFVQVHSYPDRRYPRRDLSVLARPCATLGVSKPVLIGECPANSDRMHPSDHLPPPFSLVDYLNLARDAGYLGAWPWSFKGVDGFGATDTDAMQAWIAADQDRLTTLSSRPPAKPELT